ncbi:cation:proton antiporter domain-containing protein [Deferrisoma palaeochoriense]
MTVVQILGDYVLVLALTVAVVYLFHRVRVPAVVGFIAAGVALGPHGFGLVERHHEIEILAEIGVVLLLFSIGIEFSVERLWQLRRVVFGGGAVQVALAGALVAGAAHLAGLSPPSVLVLALAASLSSTALVARLAAERAEVDSPQGRAALSLLIFQDLCVVPMILVVDWLGGHHAGWAGLAWTAAKGVGFMAGALAAARWVVPALLRAAVGTRRREVFLLTVLGLALGAAWASAQAGLSMALGAFVAGLILSESEFGIQAFGDIAPLREIFTILFFVSVGMLLDPRVIWESPGMVLGGTAVATGAKALAVAAGVLVAGYPLRIAAAAALALAQIGEFSFVLAQEAASRGVIAPAEAQWLVASTCLTMGVTPWLYRAGGRVAGWRGRLGRWALVRGPSLEPEDTAPALEDHVVVVGYGVNGRNVVRALEVAGIPYVVVELNPHTVRQERKRGVRILYGDATSPDTLVHAGVERARVVVVAVSDAASTRRIVAQVRRLNPAAHLIVRTRYVLEVPALLRLGAADVIPEEFETSVEIFVRVLRRYLVPRETVEALVAEIRQGAYEMLRGLEAEAAGADLGPYLAGVALQTVRVAADSPVAGKTLAEAALRSRTGATAVAVRHPDGRVIANPPPGTRLAAGDELVLIGDPAALAEAARLLSPAPPEPEIPPAPPAGR